MHTHLNPSRRDVLKTAASGFGYLAFASLAQRAWAETHQTQATHFSPRAKNVIFLCMNGGPSHVDLFDYKPELIKRTGANKEGLPASARLMGPVQDFAQHGESGQWISKLMPHLSAHADELCVIRSMHTDLPNHSQAFIQMHTGSFQFVRPSLGAWTLYGLGTENENLPGFVTLSPPSDNGGARNFGSAFLPPRFQGTRIGTNQIPEFYAKMLGVEQEPGPPLRNVGNSFMTKKQQREQLDLVRDLNEQKLSREGYQPEIEGAIQSFELAFRMQDEIPELLELSNESEETMESYGIGSGKASDPFGRQCLLARRMVEAGVRFVELTSPVSWDHHYRLDEELAECCEATDQPIAALLGDLRQRGLLDETLVIWAGEFGRTPFAQGFGGRDHNNLGYTTWMAGGGTKGGLSYGATDEIGHRATENPVHIHDWHATILHLLGLDHKRLTFNYAGRDFRLTDVYGNVVKEILS